MKIMFKPRFKLLANEIMRKNDYKFKSNNERYYKYFMIKKIL